MTTNELRRGNLVYFEESLTSLEPVFINEISIDSVIITSILKGLWKRVPIEKIHGVPINNYLEKIINLFAYSYNGNELYIYIGTDKIEKPIKYYHELQNLYFALTGEEI